MMQSPIVQLVSSIDWQLFATLTFKNPVPSGWVAGSMVRAFLRGACRVGHVHYEDHYSLVRGELGEATSRFHFHVLLGGLGPFAATTKNRLRIIEGWSRLRFHRGSFTGVRGDHCDLWPYVSTLAGVSYVLKGIERYADEIAAQSYEATKFGLTDRVTFSDKLSRRVRETTSYRDRRGIRQTPKQGETVSPSMGASKLNKPPGTLAHKTVANDETQRLPCAPAPAVLDSAASPAGSNGLSKAEVAWLCRPLSVGV